MLIFKTSFSVDNMSNYGKCGVCMISYEPLWRTMNEKGVTKYTLIYKMGFSAYTITNLKRNKSITMNTLEKLCKVLECTPNDIIEFKED